MVTIKYGNSMSQIIGGMLPSVSNQLSMALSYDVPNADRTNAYLKGWNGRIRLYHKGNKSFPSGLIYLVENILIENDVDYQIVGREFPDIQGYIDVEKTTLRDYQLRAVVDAIEAGRGVIQIATAGGKSHVAIGIISLIGRRSLVVVHRKELLNQMIEHCEDARLNVGRIQGSNSVRFFHSSDWDKQVFCAMAQTLNQIRQNDLDTFNDFVQRIEVFIVDEAQHYAAKTLYATMMGFSFTPYRFGLSATPKGRSDNADLLLNALTGDIIVNVGESELIDKGWIASPTVYMIEVEAPHYSRYDWTSVYKEGIVNNRERNILIKDIAIKLMQEGKLVLIICNHIRHGLILKDLLNKNIKELPEVSFIHGNTLKGVREGELNRFRRADTVCLIGSNILREGVDIPKCDAVIIAEGLKSKLTAIQRVGRVLRPNKTGKAIVVDFLDRDSNYGMLLKHSYSRISAYKERGFPIELLQKEEVLKRDFNDK